jgi:hypothetical protein
MMLMRFVFAVVLALLLAPADLRAEELGGAEADAIRQVIENQMAAFKRDDAAEAYSYASPGIQTMFPTPDVFMSMVKQGYMPVYRPQQVEFRELKLEGSVISQDVYVIGPDGRGHIARYTMEQQPDGSWRINGCYLTTAPDLSA